MDSYKKISPLKKEYVMWANSHHSKHNRNAHKVANFNKSFKLFMNIKQPKKGEKKLSKCIFFLAYGIVPN